MTSSSSIRNVFSKLLAAREKNSKNGQANNYQTKNQNKNPTKSNNEETINNIGRLDGGEPLQLDANNEEDILVSMDDDFLTHTSENQKGDMIDENHDSLLVEDFGTFHNGNQGNINQGNESLRISNPLRADQYEPTHSLDEETNDIGSIYSVPKEKQPITYDTTKFIMRYIHRIIRCNHHIKWLEDNQDRVTNFDYIEKIFQDFYTKRSSNSLHTLEEYKFVTYIRRKTHKRANGVGGNCPWCEQIKLKKKDPRTKANGRLRKRPQRNSVNVLDVSQVSGSTETDEVIKVSESPRVSRSPCVSGPHELPDPPEDPNLSEVPEISDMSELA